MEKLIKKPEAAEILGIAVQTLDKWVRTRRIPYVKYSAGVRFRPSDLQRFIDARTVPASKR